MGVARVLVVDVRGEIDRRIGPELVGDVGRDGLREAFRLAGQRRARARHDPHEQHGLHDEHRGERQDEADRDAPVEAAVPALGAGGWGLEAGGCRMHRSIVAGAQSPDPSL